MPEQKFPSRSAKRNRSAVTTSVLVLGLIGLWALEAHSQSDAREARLQRGRRQFAQSCAFCHGTDATGGRAPDLVRSPLVAHDQGGDLIGEVIRNGRPDKGMPAQPASQEEIADIAAFLHARALEAIQSSGVPSDYPVEKLLTGNVDAGKAFFDGAGGHAAIGRTDSRAARAFRRFHDCSARRFGLVPILFAQPSKNRDTRSARSASQAAR
jgi:mono/diheme cytochrome c family protein